MSYGKRMILSSAIIGMLAYFSGLPIGSAQTHTGAEIVGLATEKCLDVAGGSVGSGIDVNQYRCHEGPNQKWISHNASAPGYVYFVNQNSNLCLDIRIGGPKNGTFSNTRATTATISSSDSSRLWTV
jgi:hypothetical protein